MKLTLHLLLLRHREHVTAGIDRFAPKFAKDIKVAYEKSVGMPVQLSVTAPTSSEIRSSDRLFCVAPRLWLDFTIESPLDFDPDAFSSETSDVSARSPASQLIWKCIGAMEEVIAPRVLAANIARPGLISIFGGEFKADGHTIVSAPVLQNHLLDQLEVARDLGWPKEVRVAYPEALVWVSGVLSAHPFIGGTPVSRALAAFSHIAARGDNSTGHLELFWAMMGLEALYCDGTEALKRQLFDKAAVVFGPLSENKKRVRRLYDFRSSLVHGGMSIPYSFTGDYDDTGIDSFHHELYEAESIAYLLLLASLQFLVRRKRVDLQFTYKLA